MNLFICISLDWESDGDKLAFEECSIMRSQEQINLLFMKSEKSFFFLTMLKSTDIRF